MTNRQRDILSYVRKEIEADGICPTYQNIADYFGITKPTVWVHIRALVAQGLLKVRRYRRQGLALTGVCPACGK